MRFADEQDLGSDGFSAEERERYESLQSRRAKLDNLCNRIRDARLGLLTLCPAAKPHLLQAETEVCAAIEEIRRDLAVMMGDE